MILIKKGEEEFNSLINKFHAFFSKQTQTHDTLKRQRRRRYDSERINDCPVSEREIFSEYKLTVSPSIYSHPLAVQFDLPPHTNTNPFPSLQKKFKNNLLREQI